MAAPKSAHRSDITKRTVVLLLAAGAVVAFMVSRGISGGGKGADPAASGSAASGKPRRALPWADSAPAGTGTSARLAALEENTGKKVFSSKWGSGPEELGHERPDEGNPWGPMSLAVDGKGRVHVLDSVNGRIVRRKPDGSPDTSTTVSLTDLQDMAIGADGTTAVLDRFVDRSVAVYDEAGALQGELALEGEGLDDVGLVTGVFVDGNDVYVEKEHGPLLKIGDTKGHVAEPRTEIPGRPSRDGLLFLNAGITDAEAGRVWVSAIERASNEHRFTRELRLKSFVQQIVLLDTDKAGTIYFAAEVELADQQHVVLLQCLEPQKGVPLGGAVLPVNTLPEETFRDFAVLDEGGVVHALRTEEGVTYTRYDCE